MEQPNGLNIGAVRIDPRCSATLRVVSVRQSTLRYHKAFQAVRSKRALTNRLRWLVTLQGL